MTTPRVSPDILAEVVDTAVGIVYENCIREFGYHPNTDMSRSDKCHVLTQDLMGHLQSGNLAVRRELHKNPQGLWHYVIAHSNTRPSPEDIITDVNPWFFRGGEMFTGYLHGPRQEVMQTLEQAGMSEMCVALRAVSTIVRPHVKELIAADTHPPLRLR